MFVIYRPINSWSITSLRWLGEEVGCTKNPGNIWTKIKDCGIQIPQIITVKTRDGSALEPNDSHEVDSDTGSLLDSIMLCDSNEKVK